MSNFFKWLVGTLRSLLADMFLQIIAFFMLIFSGLVWFYFSTPFAVIPVVVIAFALGIFMYNIVEGKDN